jgi:hypothetical protein
MKGSRNKINKAWLAQSLFFNELALDIQNSAINYCFGVLLARRDVCKLTKIVIPEAVLHL